MVEDGGRLRILDALEQGQLSVEEALRKLEGKERDGAAPEYDRRSQGWWWVVSLAAGVVMTGMGAWMVVLGNWWWLGAVPALVLGVALMTAGALGRGGPWLEVGWRGPGRCGAVRFRLALPLRLVARVLRFSGRWTRWLDRTALDELVVALEQGMGEAGPLMVEVEHGETGESIRVRLG